MAVSQDDIDRLHRAITSGTLQVRFSDGRSVTYRSVNEIVTAIGILRDELATDSSRTTYAEVCRG